MISPLQHSSYSHRPFNLLSRATSGFSFIISSYCFGVGLREWCMAGVPARWADTPRMSLQSIITGTSMVQVSTLPDRPCLSSLKTNFSYIPCTFRTASNTFTMTAILRWLAVQIFAAVPLLLSVRKFDSLHFNREILRYS